MSGPGRVLLLGLDAADADLVERWCADGFLPNISRMRERGTWARLGTTADVVHVSAWPSIFTGTTPDEHGLYHAYVMQPGVQSPQRPRPDRSPHPFLWKILSDEGRRSAVMDAFLTCPVRDLKGSQILEWGTWSWFWEPTVLPDDLAREMEERIGAYPAEDHSRVGMVPVPDPDGFHRRLLAAVEKKTEAVKWLMSRDEWDLFLVVFGECHPAGHYFWHYQDEEYPTHEEGGGRLATALRDVYVALDRAIGEVIDHAGDDTTVYLVSGDGMGPNYSGSHLLENLLERMGHFNAPSPGAADATSEEAGAARARKKRDLLSALRGMVPKGLRAFVSRVLLPRSVKEKLSLRWKTANIAWDRTRAFLIENANEGYIRINLRGREPEGIVEPGEEYEALCRELVAVAKSLTNPANGKPAALAVHRTSEIYDGPCVDQFPDVIISWNEDARITTEMAAEGLGVAVSKLPGCKVMPFYTGNHRPTAFACAQGPGIEAGGELAGAHILDLAPTVLTRLGVDVPAHMHGRAREELGGGDPVGSERA